MAIGGTERLERTTTDSTAAVEVEKSGSTSLLSRWVFVATSIQRVVGGSIDGPHFVNGGDGWQ